MPALSENTQAILLLTAPLILGRKSTEPDLLKSGEYKRLAKRLHDLQHEPADLLRPGADEIVTACGTIVETDRLRRLLDRGFQLSQAIERWQSRAIWAISRADPEYPRRLKTRLRGDAPPILYGCGEPALLDHGGLAVVGSRHVDEILIDYTLSIGQLAARAGRAVISGGARGIDQAAMRGALEAGGRVSGVLADSLEKQAMNREHRDMVLDDRLTLISPYDPNAGFNVGNAMQRNKLIYALADAALVVSSDIDKGGTWTGAVEQIEKLKLVPVYVRGSGVLSPGLDALRRKGAKTWPEPEDADALDRLLDAPADAFPQTELALPAAEASLDIEPPASVSGQPDAELPDARASPAAKLLEEAGKLIRDIASTPIREMDVADALQITPTQAKAWLSQLVQQGVLEKVKNPVRYVTREQGLL